MNLRFIEAFYWVATLQSVTQAAEKLHLTQSAMSSRIAALEADLGVQLLDRSLRRIRLTGAGSRFLGHARSMLDLMREARLQNRSNARQAAPLRLGTIDSVMQAWLIHWLPELGAELPGLAIELSVDTTPALQDQMERGALDLAFTALPASCPGVFVRPLPAQPMVFLTSPERHPRPACDLSELSGAEFMTAQRGSHSHFALLDLFRQHQLAPGAVHTIASIATMVQLAEEGFGIAVLPRDTALSLLPGRYLHILETRPALPPMSLFASYRSDGATSMADEVLRSALAFIASRSEALPNPQAHPNPNPASTREQKVAADR